MPGRHLAGSAIKRLAVAGYEPLDVGHLPADWQTRYEDEGLQSLGEDGFRRGASAYLIVPSAIVPEERNIIVNPTHPDFATLVIHPPRDFFFDERLHPLSRKMLSPWSWVNLNEVSRRAPTVNKTPLVSPSGLRPLTGCPSMGFPVRREAETDHPSPLTPMPAIKVENLGKSYLVGHNAAQSERYTALCYVRYLSSRPRLIQPHKISIHPTAFIHDKALIDPGASIGSCTRVSGFSHVLGGARIGSDCNICEQVLIENDVIIGDRVIVKCGPRLRSCHIIFSGPL